MPLQSILEMIVDFRWQLVGDILLLGRFAKSEILLEISVIVALSHLLYVVFCFNWNLVDMRCVNHFIIIINTESFVLYLKFDGDKTICDPTDLCGFDQIYLFVKEYIDGNS